MTGAPESLRLQAMAALHAGDIPAATRLAQQAVALDPMDVAALRTLSGILDAAGDRGEAIRVANDAVLIAPADAELRLHLGAMLIAEQRWQDAAQHLSVHVVSPAVTPLGWRLLSSALHHAGATLRAIDAARAAVRANPNDIDYRLNLISLLTARALYDEALDELQTAVAQAPANALVWRILSGVQAARGQSGEALRAAERAVQLAPDNAECKTHLAFVGSLYVVPMPNGNPSHWAVPHRQTPAAPQRPTSLSADIGTRWRVIYAIMLRDIRTRFGHTRLGYFWAIMEPITHLMTLGTIFFLLNHGPPPVGDNLFLYYITGLVPFLMFSHVSHDVMSAAETNNVMLQLPIVQRTDIVAAHALRQFATELCVGIIIFSTAGLLGQRGVPSDPLTALAAVTALWGLALGIGAFNLVIVEMFPSYETIYAAMLRLLYVSSGIYYSPIAMPDWIREALAWNPILQGIEFFRSGFFPQYDPHWLDVSYLMTWIVAAIGIGFALERGMRAKMVIHT